MLCRPNRPLMQATKSFRRSLGLQGKYLLCGVLHALAAGNKLLKTDLRGCDEEALQVSINIAAVQL